MKLFEYAEIQTRRKSPSNALNVSWRRGLVRIQSPRPVVHLPFLHLHQLLTRCGQLVQD